MAQKIVKERVDSVKTQVRTLGGFIKGTSGPFETADTIVRQFRSANRRMLAAIGVSRVRTKIPGISNLRRRLRL